MGKIHCTLNAGETITITSISGPHSSTTWARFHQPLFQFSGGQSFNLVLSVPSSAFRFASPPILWDTNGQPTWIDVLSQSSTQLTLEIDSAAVGSSEFTVLNTTPGIPSITINIESLGGSGSGNGGTMDTYVGDDQTAMVGPMPAEVVASGTDMQFGFKDTGVNELVFALEGIEPDVDWEPEKPSFIEVTPTSSSQLTFTINNSSSARTHSAFRFETSSGSIDPTIITNPDENGPKAGGRARGAAS